MAAHLWGPPTSEFNNPVVAKTIQENPHLFKIVTPIKVDVFESYLTSHPNQPFVQSVCKGLKEGFWPWASTMAEGYPEMNDESKGIPKDEQRANFLQSQRDIELVKEHFSPSFGKDLLPGMYSMLIYAVPKLSLSDYRMVTDQSCGRHLLNSMIQHDQVTGYPLDNMVHFGEILMDIERREPGKRQVTWKSDIAEAYRNIPMHLFWQIKQVNTVNGQCHIDRCNTFGGCGSGAIFISVNSLVAWIAKNKKAIHYLLDYVNDSSGCRLENDMAYYSSYKKLYPKDLL